jgi:antibiotic biosynthesis monooxygenase (ABM) superfamily enzyme
MLLAVLLAPHLKGLGLAASMLVSNLASCVLLEWAGMPVVRRLLRPWLRAGGKNERAVTLVGLALIVATLVLMAFLFSLVTG